MDRPRKPRVLVFIVAYNAEKTIGSVVGRIPAALADTYDIEILIIDDASSDRTFERGHTVQSAGGAPFPIRVLVNPVNQGYGGNQKLGYHYALKYGFDFVALVHGDGQYAPECLPELLEPLRMHQASAVFGTRMMVAQNALKGGMPLYKFVGNRILTWFQNKVINGNLTEYHSGYRIYATDALAKIPFDRNSNDFHFDTEIIIQLLAGNLKIRELPIPTYYGDEICHVNGLKYAFNVVAATVTAKLQGLGLLYDPKFDCVPPGHSVYQPKLSYRSPHSLALGFVRRESRVLDLGCAGGYMARVLYEKKNCSVTGVDAFPSDAPGMSRFLLHDLNSGPPPIPIARFDHILMLDVVEHLTQPERFLEQLRQALALNPEAELILSTGNVGFLITRLMLLAGQFNYGKRGILDLTHTRLFTFASLRRTLEQSGFAITETIGVPGPFPLALGDNFLAHALTRINSALIYVSRGLFSYQIMVRARALPILETLLDQAEQHSAVRLGLLELSKHSGTSQPVSPVLQEQSKDHP